jgi:hypothetical protein
MAVAWFLAPYKRRDSPQGVPGRYCAMDDFTAQILADGGGWAEAECLGNMAVVKVRATAATLQTINQTAGFTGVPGSALNDPLSSLTQAQKNALRNKILSLGYTAQELQNALGTDLGAVTLGQLLRFVLTRRLRPRFDQPTGTIICDGPQDPTVAPESVDGEV